MPLWLGSQVQAVSREVELKLIDVVVGVITDDQDRVLIQQRTDGPFAGQWEFPGGKRESGETYFDALARELREENGIEVRRSSPLIHITHRYPDRAVSLNTFFIDRYDGVARGAEGQAVRWASRRALYDADLLAADRPLSVAINLPHEYLITPPVTSRSSSLNFIGELDQALARGAGLVCLRAPELDDDAYERLARLAVASCRRAGARLMLHGDARRAPLVRELGVSGLHLSAVAAADLDARPLDADLLLAASALSADDLTHAHAINADFATLGWDGFNQQVESALLPVYATGGLRRANIGQVRAQGGQGIVATPVATKTDYIPS